MLNGKSPRFRGFVRIGRTNDRKPGDCAQAGEVLDWLVSRAILSESDAVVRKHVDRTVILNCKSPRLRSTITGAAFWL